MFFKLKKVVVFLKIFTCLLLSRPLITIMIMIMIMIMMMMMMMMMIIIIIILRVAYHIRRAGYNGSCTMMTTSQ